MMTLLPAALDLRREFVELIRKPRYFRYDRIAIERLNLPILELKNVATGSLHSLARWGNSAI
jgi:hypothetical protein